MASTIIYYACDTYLGSSQVNFPDGESLPDDAYPDGCLPLTQEEYDAEVAARAAARAAEDEALRDAEAKRNKKIAGGTTVLVAAADAPDHVREAALFRCDGGDDQVQINQALNEAAADGGGKVTLSSGTFHLNEPIAIPASQGLTLEGDGWGTVLRVAGGVDRYAVHFNGAGDTRVQLRDMTINANGGEQSAGGGVWAPGAVQCLFENLHVTDFYDTGIYLGPQADGSFGHHNRISNCLFDNTMTSLGDGTAIHMVSSDENFVMGCDFEYLGGETGRAAAVYDQAGTQFVSMCNFVNGRPGLPAIRVQDTSSTKVVSCNFDGVGGDGVFLSASQCVVASNTFFGVGLGSTPGTVTGVHLEFAARYNAITGNTLATAETDGAANSLVREDGDGDAGHNLFHGNVLIENGTTAYGLMTLNGTGSTVRDNTGSSDYNESAPVKLVSGPVSDASFPANRPPVDGTLAVDTSTEALYVRVNGSWMSLPLT